MLTLPCSPVCNALLPRSYMVVLRHGGVYADLDAECRRPLDGVIASRDTLVAGWDTEWADPRSALEAG